MPSLAKHHLLRAYLPLMVPFRTRFSRCEVVRVAYVQRLIGYLYTRGWISHILTLRFKAHVDLPVDARPFPGDHAMTIVFVSVSHTLCNLAVQTRQLRSELLDLYFEVFAFANEAIELRRHACCSFL